MDFRLFEDMITQSRFTAAADSDDHLSQFAVQIYQGLFPPGAKMLLRKMDQFLFLLCNYLFYKTFIHFIKSLFPLLYPVSTALF